MGWINRQLCSMYLLFWEPLKTAACQKLEEEASFSLPLIDLRENFVK